MNYQRCTCEWCHPELPLFWHVDDPDDIDKVALEVLEMSGPFDYPDVAHTLALALRAGSPSSQEPQP